MNNLEKVDFIKTVNYKFNTPFAAELVAKEIIGLSEPDCSLHLVLDITGSNISFLEGHSIGVIPPGEREDGRAHKARLYSIASSRFGENNNKNLLALSIKRLVYTTEGVEQFGLCSDYLYTAKIGTKINIISPTGRIMLLPKANDVDLIMIGTGTGVAPFRAYLQNFQQTGYMGKLLLFLGYKYQSEALYCNEYNQDLINYCSNLDSKLITALSRTQKNEQQGKMYVGDRLLAEIELLTKIIDKANYSFYICGLKGMELAIEKVLATICQKLSLNWAVLQAELKSAGRWNVETY